MEIELISESVEKRGCKLNEAKKRSSDKTRWRTFYTPINPTPQGKREMKRKGRWFFLNYDIAASQNN